MSNPNLLVQSDSNLPNILGITARGEYFSLGCDNHHGKVLKFGKFAEKF